MIEALISIAFYASTAITFLILLLPSQYAPKHPSESQEQSSDSQGHVSREQKTTVQILVLGDIGRSPRMQYHALSIAKYGGQVDIIGYHGELRRAEIWHSLMNYSNTSGRIGNTPRYLLVSSNFHRPNPSAPGLSADEQQTPLPPLCTIEGDIPGCLFVAMSCISDRTGEMAPRPESPVNSYPRNCISRLLSPAHPFDRRLA